MDLLNNLGRGTLKTMELETFIIRKELRDIQVYKSFCNISVLWLPHLYLNTSSNREFTI